MSMILPDDILKEISAFSKPIFRYRTQYKAVCKCMAVYEWPELKDKLYKNELVPVMTHFLECAKNHNERSSHFANLYKDALDAILLAVYNENPPRGWWKEHSTWWKEDDSD